MSRRQRNDDDASTPFASLGSSHHGSFRVVATLHQDVWTQSANQLARRILSERDHRVDRLQRRENIAPFGRAANWPLGTLQTFDRIITIHADNEAGSLPSRTDENVDMSRMQQVEYAVCEDYWTGHGLTPFRRSIPIHDLRERVERIRH